MDRLSQRLGRIEKTLEEQGQGKFVSIWTESMIPHWPELGVWALGYTQQRPDCWPSEDQEAALRLQGYTVPTREELREEFESLLELRRRHLEVERKMGLCPMGFESDEPGIEEMKERLRTIP